MPKALAVQVVYPEGPRTHMSDTWVPKWPYRKHFKACHLQSEEAAAYVRQEVMNTGTHERLNSGPNLCVAVKELD